MKASDALRIGASRLPRFNLTGDSPFYEKDGVLYSNWLGALFHGFTGETIINPENQRKIYSKYFARVFNRLIFPLWPNIRLIFARDGFLYEDLNTPLSIKIMCSIMEQHNNWSREEIADQLDRFLSDDEQELGVFVPAECGLPPGKPW